MHSEAAVGDTRLQPRDFRCPVFVSRSVRSSSFFFKGSAGARTSQRDFSQKATKGTKIFPNSDSIAKLRHRHRLLAHKAGALRGVFTEGSEKNKDSIFAVNKPFVAFAARESFRSFLLLNRQSGDIRKRFLEKLTKKTKTW
jgi:hypothetical protein